MPNPPRPADGAYIGRLQQPQQQSISLQIRPDDSARLVVLYALHTPPGVVEILETRLQTQDGRWCLVPAPKTFAPCIDTADGQPALVHIATGTRVSLTPVRD